MHVHVLLSVGFFLMNSFVWDLILIWAENLISN